MALALPRLRCQHRKTIRGRRPHLFVSDRRGLNSAQNRRRNTPNLVATRSEKRLFDRHAFRQVTRLVNIAAPQDRNMVGQQLQRNAHHDRL